jgi:hypothetical protein
VFAHVHLCKGTNIPHSDYFNREVSVEIDNIERLVPKVEAENEWRQNWRYELLQQSNLVLNQIKCRIQELPI